MESKNKNQSNVETRNATFHATTETRHEMSLQDAWTRFMDNSCTIDDLKLILESIRNGEDLHECHEVLNRIWNKTFSDNTPLEAGEWKKYKREARRMYAEMKRNRKILTKPVPTRTIHRFRTVWYAAAAALLLGLLIPAAYFYMKPKTEQSELVVQYIEAITHHSEIKTVVLPDQTKVTLNAESRLKYPAVFANERSVELQGEALFEVTSDPERPFTVATTDMDVSVLGTVFDVKAYPDDGLLMVSVVSGKVEVGLTGKIGETGETGGGSSILLEKNHQVKIDKATGIFERFTIDADKYLSWTDGTLYFYQTPIREVINMLNRYYPQMDIELSEGEYSNLISGEHDAKRPEAVLMSIIYSTGLKYKKAGNKIILYKDNKK